MKKLLPVLIALFGLGGGLAAGAVLKPEAAAMTVADGGHGDADSGHGESADHGASDGHGSDDGGHGDNHAGGGHGDGSGSSEFVYVGLEKPFFVPVLREGKQNTLVRLDIHLEIPESLEELVHKHDPKLRDAFLRTVMNFSHQGGFARVHGGEGFTILRDSLLVSARSVLGSDVKAVLIGEILTRDS